MTFREVLVHDEPGEKQVGTGVRGGCQLPTRVVGREKSVDTGHERERNPPARPERALGHPNVAPGPRNLKGRGRRKKCGPRPEKGGIRPRCSMQKNRSKDPVGNGGRGPHSE